MRNLLTALLGAALIFSLAACQPDEIPPVPTPSAAPTAPLAVVGGRLVTPVPTATATPLPTPTPTDVPVATPVKRTLSVAIVGNDQAYTRLPSAREGLQRAARDLDVEVFEMPAEPGDIARSASRAAEGGYDLVIVGSGSTPLGEWLAKRYPQTRFVIFGRVSDPPPPNLVGLWFAEDQAGFLAGALAGWITQRDMVAFVGAYPTEEIVKFRKGYEHGVQYVSPKAIVLGAYISSFTAPRQGGEEAEAQLDEGADVLFAAGGTTARGAIEAAAGRGVPVIAAEVDPYSSLNDGAPQLASSVIVRADKAVYEVIQAAKQNTLQAGTRVYDLKNGGIELGSFHDWAGKLPEEAQRHLSQTLEGLRDGSVKTNVDIPEY